MDDWGSPDISGKSSVIKSYRKKTECRREQTKPKTSKEKEQTNYFKKSELKNQHLKIGVFQNIKTENREEQINKKIFCISHTQKTWVFKLGQPTKW